MNYYYIHAITIQRYVRGYLTRKITKHYLHAIQVLRYYISIGNVRQISMHAAR